MNQVVLDAITPSAIAPLDSGGAKPDAAAPGADLFRATLADRMQLAAPPAKPTAATDANPAEGAQQALEAKITTMLKAGASPADVITTLAAKLASSVSANLGDDGTDARAKLQAMFAAALAPPGTTDDAGGSAADRARILAQRYVRIATVAATVSGQDSGQQKRITGTVLDAQRAKDIPARTKTTSNATTTKTALPVAGPRAAGTSDANAVAASTLASVSGTIVAAAVEVGALPQPVPATLENAAKSIKRLPLPAANVNVGNAAATLSDRSALHATSSVVDPAITVAARPVESVRDFSTASAVPASATPAATATPNAITGPAVTAASAAIAAPTASAASSSVATPAAIATMAPTSIAGAVTMPPAAASASAIAVHRLLEASSSVPETSSPTAGIASLPVTTALLTGDAANVKSASNKRSSTTNTKSDAVASAAGILGRASSANAEAASAVPSSAAAFEPLANAGADGGRIPLSAAAPAADTAVGDGRTVDLGSTAATQTGGDTSLGRTLVRAALVADSNPVAVSGDGTSPVEPASSAPPNDLAPDSVVSAFVKAFEVALNAGTTSDAARSAQHDVPASLLALPVHETATSAAAFVPTVAPFTIDRAASTLAAAPAPAPAPIDHSAIADQVLRGAFMRNVGESSEIRLSLVPDSLGDVSVKLVVDAGNVTAHVVAQTSDVRDALVAAQPQLTKSLADSGLKLTSFTVDLQGSGFAGFAQQQNDQSQNGNRSRRLANSTDADGGSDETLLEAIPSFGPASVTGPGAYNYLA